jgi:neuroligin
MHFQFNLMSAYLSPPPAGFLNANVDRYSKSPANYGLMDILAALHWIQENIEAFGGDNKSVTLAGHGTGAACVHFLIASQAVPDSLLFHRAILMSGTGLAPWSLVGDPAYYAAIVAHHVNCSVDLPHQALMKCLRDVSLKSLLSTPVRVPDFGNAFGPSVDGVVIGEFLEFRTREALTFALYGRRMLGNQSMSMACCIIPSRSPFTAVS